MNNTDTSISLRYEEKYLVDQKWYDFLISKLHHLASNKSYLVTSQYYDSKDYIFYTMKVDGSYKKYKLRKRSYDKKPFFYEIKIKNGKKNYKERFSDQEDAFAFFSGLQPNIKIDQFPKIEITYKRDSFLLYDEMRITIDSNLEFCDLISKTQDKASNFIIVECKGEKTPFWIKKLLNEANATHQSFSKYAYALQRLKGFHD